MKVTKKIVILGLLGAAAFSNAIAKSAVFIEQKRRDEEEERERNKKIEIKLGFKHYPEYLEVLPQKDKPIHKNVKQHKQSGSKFLPRTKGYNR